MTDGCRKDKEYIYSLIPIAFRGQLLTKLSPHEEGRECNGKLCVPDLPIAGDRATTRFSRRSGSVTCNNYVILNQSSLQIMLKHGKQKEAQVERICAFRMSGKNPKHFIRGRRPVKIMAECSASVQFLRGGIRNKMTQVREPEKPTYS